MTGSFIVAWINSLVERHQTSMVNRVDSFIRLRFLGFCNLPRFFSSSFWSQIFVIFLKQGASFGTFFVKYNEICFQIFQSNLETHNHQEHSLKSRFRVKCFFKIHNFPTYIKIWLIYMKFRNCYFQFMIYFIQQGTLQYIAKKWKFYWSHALS